MYPTWLEWSGVLLVITAWPPKIAGAKRGPSYSQMFLCLGNRDRHIQKVMQGTKIWYKITKKKKKVQGEPLHGLQRDPKTVLWLKFWMMKLGLRAEQLMLR